MKINLLSYSDIEAKNEVVSEVQMTSTPKSSIPLADVIISTTPSLKVRSYIV